MIFYGNIYYFDDDIHFGHNQETSNAAFDKIISKDPQLLADIALRGYPTPFDITGMTAAEVITKIRSLGMVVHDNELITTIINVQNNKFTQRDVNLAITKSLVVRKLPLIRDYINQYYRYILHNNYPQIFNVIETLDTDEDITINTDDIQMLADQINRLASLEGEMAEMAERLEFVSEDPEVTIKERDITSQTYSNVLRQNL